jgi:hypothetical protein
MDCGFFYVKPIDFKQGSKYATDGKRRKIVFSLKEKKELSKPVDKN